MANPSPLYKTPPKFPDINGMAVKCKTVKIADYLVKEIEEHAQFLHRKYLAEGKAPIMEDKSA